MGFLFSRLSQLICILKLKFDLIFQNFNFLGFFTWGFRLYAFESLNLIFGNFLHKISIFAIISVNMHFKA
jgi:hypothetical protein